MKHPAHLTLPFTFPRIPITLVAILFLATFLRFAFPLSSPPSLNLDEVAIGFNAYSILKTGRDEYGTRFPLAFRSHDDYKAPLYIYLTSVMELIIGYNPGAVRFTSALAGTLSVALTYWLTQQLISSRKFASVPLLASLLLAISPWHIQFSRAAYETNLCLFFILLGFYFFFKGLDQPKLWYVSSLAFVASLYSYHSSKIFLPPLFLLLAFIFRRQLQRHTRHLTVAASLFLLLVLPLVKFTFSPEGRLRFQGTSVFTTPTLIQTNQEQRLALWRQGRELQAKIFHHRYLAALMTLAHGYFSHFDYDFLFHGEYGPPQHHAPNVGLLYLWELPFILFGFYALFRLRLPQRYFLLAWILLAPLPAAFTWDIPSSTRTEITLPTYQILTALGIVFCFSRLHRLLKLFAQTTLASLMLFSFFHFVHNYFYVAPQIHAAYWQYGYQQAVQYTQQNLNRYSKVVVSTNLRQPQNFWAFYTRYDPSTYIFTDGGTVSGGFSETRNHFGSFSFHPIDYQDLQPDTLYVDSPSQAHLNHPPLKVINLPNGEPTLVIFTAP